MRLRKIRGHKRRWKKIEDWKNYNLNLDMDYLLEYQRDYVKIRIHPWSGLSLINSVYLEPKRLTKQKMLNGLFDIYDQWKKQLDNFGKPYYLKIWLYDNRFSKTLTFTKRHLINLKKRRRLTVVSTITKYNQELNCLIGIVI